MNDWLFPTMLNFLHFTLLYVVTLKKNTKKTVPRRDKTTPENKAALFKFSSPKLSVNGKFIWAPACQARPACWDNVMTCNMTCWFLQLAACLSVDLHNQT